MAEIIEQKLVATIKCDCEAEITFDEEIENWENREVICPECGATHEITLEVLLNE